MEGTAAPSPLTPRALPLARASSASELTSARTRNPHLPDFLDLLSFAIMATLATRHSHHATSVDLSEPAGTLIWIHIVLQSVCWGILFPLGMVFGLK